MDGSGARPHIRIHVRGLALHRKSKRYHGLVPWNFMFAATAIGKLATRHNVRLVAP